MALLRGCGFRGAPGAARSGAASGAGATLLRLAARLERARPSLGGRP